MKCICCGKEIKHIYYLDGKTYGYNCYKLKVAEKYKNYIDNKNLKYSLMAISAVEIYKNHKECSSWGKEFKESIIKQFTNCNKLTYKQLSCICNRLTKEELIKYNILLLNLLKVKGTRMFSECLEEFIQFLQINKQYLQYCFTDEFIELYKKGYDYKDAKEGGEKISLIEYSIKDVIKYSIVTTEVISRLNKRKTFKLIKRVDL